MVYPSPSLSFTFPTLTQPKPPPDREPSQAGHRTRGRDGYGASTDPWSVCPPFTEGNPMSRPAKGKESPLDFTATHASALQVLACVSVSKVNSIFFR